MDKTESERRQELKEFLTDHYVQFANAQMEIDKQKGKVPAVPSEADFAAQELGWHSATYNRIKNGRQLPEAQNILRAARKHPEILKIFDLDYLEVIEDDKLKFIVEIWDRLNDETKTEILAIARAGNGGGTATS